MKQHVFIIWTVVITFLIPIESVEARAFCALRDPINSIKFLFPESDQHRSIVKAINADIRDEISERLPFTLHFNELGKHTLYAIYTGKKPIGFVHVRSELTEWGLVEIAWGLDTSLTVRSVQFQRCRIPDCEGKHLADVLNLTVGKSYGEILKYISQDGKSLLPEVAGKLSAPSFAFAAIKSALKTITITSIAWQKEVMDINRQLFVEAHFDGKHILKKRIIASERFNKLEEMMGGGGSMINRNSTEVFQVIHNNSDHGRIVTATWRDKKFNGLLNWLFDVDGKVIAIQPIPAWPNLEVLQIFQGLYGMKLSSLEQCQTAAELMAYELYYLSRKEGD